MNTHIHVYTYICMTPALEPKQLLCGDVTHRGLGGNVTYPQRTPFRPNGPTQIAASSCPEAKELSKAPASFNKENDIDRVMPRSARSHGSIINYSINFYKVL